MRSGFGFVSLLIFAVFSLGLSSPSARPSGRDDGVTYADSVAPILSRRCIGCHHDGGTAPFSLIGYQNAQKWSAMMRDVTKSGYMPPWKAVPGYSEFLDENVLSKDELSTLQTWVDEGALRGDASKEPPAPTFDSSWPQGTPDKIVGLEKPFPIPADKNEYYRSFVLNVSFKKPTWVKCVAVRPGNPRVVHHIIVFMDSTGVAVDSQANNTDGLEGFPDDGGAPGFLPSGVLATWAPGATAHPSPKGAAMLIRPNDRIVVQIHYQSDGKEETDLSQLGLYFAKEPIRKQLMLHWIMDVDLRIPAGEKHYVESYDEDIDEDITVYTAFPHMHNLGQSMKAEVRLPNGQDEPLIWVDKWDFRWQLTYAFKNPVKVPKGSTIHIEAVYDNSESNPLQAFHPPKRIKFGKSTKAEMLLLILGYTKDKQQL